MMNLFSKVLGRSPMVLVLVLVAVTGCRPGQDKLSDNDIEAIKEVVETYQRTGLAGDYDAWSKLIAEDAIFCAPNQKPIEGREAIVSWVRTFPKLTAFKETVTEISGYRDIAYVYGKYSFTAQLEDGSSFSDEGSHIDIMRKQPDGAWLYSRHIFRSDLPMPVATSAK